MTLKAVLYDMNGVLVDDEPLHEDAFRKVLSGLGAELDHGSYQRHFAGRTDEDGFRDFFLANPVKHPEMQQLLEEKSAAYQELAAEGLEAYPGACESVQALAESKIALGLVTSSLREEADAVLRAFDLRRYFDSAVVTAEDIKIGKPDPSGYLMGAAKLGVDPENAAVIEDAPSGISAGRNAGMRVLAVAQTHSAEELSNADLVVPRLGRETVDALRDLLSRG